MSFLGKTILLPEISNVPKNFAFFKRIKYIPDDTEIMVYPKNSKPFTARVVDTRDYPDFFLCLLDNGLNADTQKDIIVEVDKVPGKVINPMLENIGSNEENAIIEEMHRDHSLKEKIPQVLKDRPSFKQKIELAKTKDSIRVVDSVGESTGIVDIPKLPDDNLHHVHSFLFGKDETKPLNPARLRKTTRNQLHAPRSLPPSQDKDSTDCRGINCVLSGGRRKRRRTRKNKRL